MAGGEDAARDSEVDGLIGAARTSIVSPSGSACRRRARAPPRPSRTSAALTETPQEMHVAHAP
jgi:hypothetical protein